MSTSLVRLVPPAPRRMLRAALALTLLASLAACSSGGGTEPVTTLGRFGTDGIIAGTWVYQLEDVRSVPMLGDGPIVADSLKLAASGSGTWSLVTLDVLDGRTHRRTDIPLEWRFANDTLRVSPTCEPRELCDPVPGWYGTFAEGGQLVLLPSFRAQQRIAPRIYERVRR
jgi:hypothetical protein